MNAQHRKKPDKDAEKKEAEVPHVSMDYFFMSKSDENAKENPVLVMVDEETGEKYARAVGRKGVGERGRDGLVDQGYGGGVESVASMGI